MVENIIDNFSIAYNNNFIVNNGSSNSNSGNKVQNKLNIYLHKIKKKKTESNLN